ncbi:cystathionine gamma-synthase [uncultured Streptococcus sp.]|uniref:cystathionine gamma-synthase n=1 Tax=uncultured Streptococcus sp. TaxID=83427 RepID=UPI0028D4DD90|nr:cystathionine gamma-synthase [uncultured Streptococcus sp.]
MTDKQFPLVSDDEIMLTEMPHMNLYDELDLISNITGDYTDRNYLEWMPIVDSSRHAPIAASQAIRRPLQKQSAFKDFKKPIDKKDPAIRYAEQAREEARADLKKKRSAPYLTSDLPTKVRSRKLPTASNAERPKPTAPFQKNTSGEFTKFGDRLQQDNYILVDIQPEYSPQPQEPEEKPKKNNYDFLKTSQIYNQDRAKEEQLKHSKAQELNLTGLDSE